MKTLKLKFCNFWSSFNEKHNLFYNLLKKHFDIEISENPDFVICSNRGKLFEYMKYDCPRIMFMGENISPDFTIFDYVIGFDHLSFGDRYMRFPFVCYTDGDPFVPEMLTEEQARRIFERKDIFCNFIYSHPSSHGMRERLFTELSKYKTVVSPGGYLNNVSGSGISWHEKYEYLTRSKFTIACDSINYPGFVTEKILQPFQYHSVPIYFGSPTIAEDFNPQAFVWCQSEKDISETVDRVVELDRNDSEYINLLKNNPLHSRMAFHKRVDALEAFLLNIFQQSPLEARRRIRHFRADSYATAMQKCCKVVNRQSYAKRLLEVLYRFKKWMRKRDNSR